MGEENSVLILMPSLFVGGSERQVRYIIEGLERVKKNVVVLVENGNLSNEQNASYVAAHFNVKFVFLNQHTFSKEDKNKKNKFKSLLCISKWILKNKKTEHIEWVMFTNLTGLLVVPVCKLLGIKVLFNERNPGIKMCDNVVKRVCLKMCNKIVANSQSAAAYMTDVLKRNVECINNGVKISEEINAVQSALGNVILVPARITRIKNQGILIKAINLLKEKMNVQVLLAGQIEDSGYAEEIKEYIRKNKLEHEIEFLGYVSNIQELYDRASLVILPSYEEGTPNVMLEAYINKKLCLASNIIMNSNVTCDERILFEVDNEYDLANKIEWITQLSEIEKLDMLDANYKYVIDNYSLSIMQGKYIAIFDN